jgi:hypothetical protein
MGGCGLEERQVKGEGRQGGIIMHETDGLILAGKPLVEDEMISV